MKKHRSLTPHQKAEIVARVKSRWAAAKGAAKKAEPRTTNGASAGSRLAKAAREKESVGRLKAAADAPAAGALMQLDPKTCRRSPWNRDHFDPERMAKMTANVEKEGVLQNGIVRRNPGVSAIFDTGGVWQVRSKGGGMLIREFRSEEESLKLCDELNAAEWEIIAGERRWTAALATGRIFPAVERQANDIEALELQLAENSDREDLNALDEARKFEQLRAAYVSQGLAKMEAMKKLQERTGLSESVIYERLALLELPLEVTAALEAGTIQASHAGLLTSLKTPAAQQELAATLLKGREVYTGGGYATEALSFREAKELASAASEAEKKELAWAKETEKHVAKGCKVLTIAQSEKVFRYGSLTSGYVSPTAKCDLDPKGQSWAALIDEEHAPQKIVAYCDSYGRHKGAEIVWPRKAAEKAVRASGHEFKAEKREDPEAARKRELEKAAREKEARFVKNCEIVAKIVAAAEAKEPNADFWRFIIGNSTANWRQGLCRRRGLTDTDEYRQQEKAFESFVEKADGKTLRGVSVEMRLWAWDFRINGDNLKDAIQALDVKLPKGKKSQTSGEEED